jgi:hypothetical protein
VRYIRHVKRSLILLAAVWAVAAVGCGYTASPGQKAWSAALAQTSTTWSIPVDSAAAVLARSRAWVHDRTYRLDVDAADGIEASGPASRGYPIRLRVTLVTGTYETVVDVSGMADDPEYRDQAATVARTVAHFLQTGRTIEDYVEEE